MIDQLVRDAARVTDDCVRSLELDDAEVELRAAILGQPRGAHDGRRPAREAGPRPRRRAHGWSVATAVAVVAAILAAALTGGGERLGTSAGRAWAAEALEVANAVPRLLVGEPGWTVERADEFTVDEGEMTFRNGDRTVDMRWGTDDYRTRVADRAASGARLPGVDVLGTTARVFHYDGTVNDFTALWRAGRYTLELRMGYPPGPDPMTAAEYRRLLASLQQVSVDEWLTAMPDSVVLPQDTAEAVDEMLAGMEAPDGFDASALRSDEAVRDRYQLGARVAGAVACAWIDRWIAATGRGDDAAAGRAARAMQASRRWPILREMTAEGAYPEVLWEYADAMTGDGTVLGGRRLTIEESYEAALGC